MEGCDKQSKVDSIIFEKINNITFFILFLFYQIVCYNQEIYSLPGRNSQFCD